MLGRVESWVRALGPPPLSLSADPPGLLDASPKTGALLFIFGLLTAYPPDLLELRIKRGANIARALRPSGWCPFHYIAEKLRVAKGGLGCIFPQF